MSQYLVFDPTARQYLARVEYPAIWTPNRANAVALDRNDYDSLRWTWPYLNGCELEPLTRRMMIRSLVETDDDGRALWWSNDDGWTVQAGATVFTWAELRNYNALPAGSIWEAV